MKTTQKIKTFLNNLKSEFFKIEWPNKKEVVNLTILVIVICVMVGVYLGVFDFVFSKLLTRLGVL